MASLVSVENIDSLVLCSNVELWGERKYFLLLRKLLTVDWRWRAVCDILSLLSLLSPIMNTQQIYNVHIELTFCLQDRKGCLLDIRQTTKLTLDTALAHEICLQSPSWCQQCHVCLYIFYIHPAGPLSAVLFEPLKISFCFPVVPRLHPSTYLNNDTLMTIGIEILKEIKLSNCNILSCREEEDIPTFL